MADDTYKGFTIQTQQKDETRTRVQVAASDGKGSRHIGSVTLEAHDSQEVRDLKLAVIQQGVRDAIDKHLVKQAEREAEKARAKSEQAKPA